MRFAFVMPYYFPDGITGGAEKQAYILALELARRGHDVFFITSKAESKPTLERDGGITVIRKLNHVGKLQFLDYPYILSELRRVKADVVISRIRFYYLPLALYALLMGKTSVAFIPENSLTLPFPETKKVLKLVSIHSPFKSLLYIIHALALDILSQIGLLISKMIIVQNDIQRRNLKRHFLRSSVKLPSIFIPPKVDTAKERNPLIIWVGNARDVKRPQLFVQLARSLPEYDFVMIGRKTESFKGSSKNLKVLGELPHSETMKWLARAWILVNTSCEEGFSNTFLEAWYLKTAVVSYGADPDGVISSGLGVKVGSGEDAAAAIKEMIKNREKIEKLIERGRNYVLKHHLPDAVVPQFLDLLKSSKTSSSVS